MRLPGPQDDIDSMNEVIELLLAERSPRHSSAILCPALTPLIRTAQVLHGARPGSGKLDGMAELRLKARWKART